MSMDRITYFKGHRGTNRGPAYTVYGKRGGRRARNVRALARGSRLDMIGVTQNEVRFRKGIVRSLSALVKSQTPMARRIEQLFARWGEV